MLHHAQRNALRVAACSAQAEALGVRIGMPVAEVAALEAGKDGGCGKDATVLVPYDPSADRKALEDLAIWCERFSPVVGVEDAPAPESLFLDITGLEHLLGDETAQAARIQAALRGRGLFARLGIADTPGAAWAAAWAAARYEGGDRGQQESIPAPHTSYSAPHTSSSPPTTHLSLTRLPPGDALTALWPMPIEALRLEDETVELLHALGVYRVGQIVPLPREDLAARFGPRLGERLDQALGLLPEPILACRAPPELRAAWSPEHPTAKREAVEAVVRQLVGQVADRLLHQGRGAVRLECRIDCPPSEPVRLSVGLYHASASAEHLFGLVRMQLERVRLSAPMTGVCIEAAVATALEHRQEQLFEEGAARHARSLASLVDRLSSRLGPRGVLRARLLADAQPELAYGYESVVGTAGKRRRKGAKSGATGCLPSRASRKAKRTRADKQRVAPRRPHANVPELPPRPLRLMSRPAGLSASSILPDGPPVQFQWQGASHRVARHWGPERIETGWWRGRPVGRDYYRVETAAGNRFWLFRRLRDGKWFLHGSFE